MRADSDLGALFSLSNLNFSWLAASFAARLSRASRCELWEDSMTRAGVIELMLSGLDGVAGRGGALSPNVPIERDGFDAMRLDNRAGDSCVVNRPSSPTSLGNAGCSRPESPLCSGLWVVLPVGGRTG